MPDQIFTHAKSGLVIRDNDDDKVVYAEIKDYYTLQVSGQKVLDIGSHVGFSMLYFLQQGAASVLGFEPDPETFEVLKRNMQAWPNGSANQHAIVGEGLADTITFYRKKNYRNGTLHKPVMGEFTEFTVPAMSFRSVLELYHPTVLKIDCEGGEYSYDFSNLPDEIKQIAIEFHLGRKVFRQAAPRLYADLQHQGFVASKEPNFEAMYCSVAVLSR